MRSFNLCGWTSVLVPTFFAGFAVASLAGSDAIGWVAAIVVAVAVAAFQARSATRASCALPPASSPPTGRTRTADQPTTTR
ncbi:MAG: hypothetical protein R2711_07480 [Acidimicrobiales bacterium]